MCQSHNRFCILKQILRLCMSSDFNDILISYWILLVCFRMSKCLWTTCNKPLCFPDRYAEENEAHLARYTQLKSEYKDLSKKVSTGVCLRVMYGYIWSNLHIVWCREDLTNCRWRAGLAKIIVNSFLFLFCKTVEVFFAFLVCIFWLCQLTHRVQVLS